MAQDRLADSLNPVLPELNDYLPYAVRLLSPWYRRIYGWHIRHRRLAYV